jgi:exodeoxyribonuclease-3
VFPLLFAKNKNEFLFEVETMKIVTFNVNSLRARWERFVPWLESRSPDVVCLQETKMTDDIFPVDDLLELGYHAAYYGQKSYNGVAILSKDEQFDVECGFADGDEEDAQARLIAATVKDIRVVCGYFPNGDKPTSEKYPYKKAWLERLQRYVQQFDLVEGPLVLCGDFNIAPEEIDLATPKKWKGGVLYNSDMSEVFHSFEHIGLTDTFRLHHPEGGHYSWWDYRSMGFQRGDGLRIDFVMCTEPLRGCCTGAWIDLDERKGETPKPSDHAPVFAEFDWNGYDETFGEDDE